MGIIMDSVSFSYGKKIVLKDIQLSVEAGEYIGIIGASGEGKSTLLKIAAGLYAPLEGRVEVEGESRPAYIRRHVAMVMQNAPLLPASIRENITCGHPMSDKTLKEALEAARLAPWLSGLPEGEDTFVGHRGEKVSGGQAQRIAIARAMAKNATVLLLDEITSALDMETGRAVLSALKNLSRGKAVIHVTHQLETLEACTRIYRLEGGRLYAAGA